MVVNSVYSLDQEELNEKLIGIKKVPGGGLQDSEFVDGVAFKKTVSYRRGERVCVLMLIRPVIVLVCWFRTAAEAVSRP